MPDPVVGRIGGGIAARQRVVVDEEDDRTRRDARTRVILAASHRAKQGVYLVNSEPRHYSPILLRLVPVIPASALYVSSLCRASPYRHHWLSSILVRMHVLLSNRAPRVSLYAEWTRTRPSAVNSRSKALFGGDSLRRVASRRLSFHATHGRYSVDRD